MTNYGLPKFKRYAINVWNIESHGKTDEEIATECLARIKDYMPELEVALKIGEVGVIEAMIDDGLICE